eukprot:CAMPEP_0174240378 /NCGR_PEP_ID=MMETSP0417-20130205/18547_1 /TAXON_ID=242541 /ORGANISM="Mayorella sp, Strain BSH-02190019" /LENGTH=1037 /DNA_ID=CAMNT_0015319461 /DNA_START=54 /DNA_END=3163 /DNA_ORIENTATION=-
MLRVAAQRLRTAAYLQPSPTTFTSSLSPLLRATSVMTYASSTSITSSTSSVQQRQFVRVPMPSSVLRSGLNYGMTGPTSSYSSKAPSASSTKQLSESHASGASANYLEQMWEEWSRDPSSVHASWNAYFSNVKAGAAPGDAHAVPPSSAGVSGSAQAAAPAMGTVPEASHEKLLNLFMLLRSFQVYGHEFADTNPLKPEPPALPQWLDPSYYGLTDEDLDRPIFVGDPNNGSPLNKYLRTDSPVLRPREYLQQLRQVYLGKIGYEYMHIADRDACNWLRDRIWNEKPMDKEKKLSTLDRLAWADMFERFLAVKWAGAKRFGLEGCESLIPGMKALIDEAGEHGVSDVVIGMPHRGRLNVLANVVRKPTSHIFHEFDVGTESEGTGDVKYHLGTSFNRRTLHGKRIHLSLVANPSHLEAVNPIVVGKTRAKQFYIGDSVGTTAMPILLHGDAAFCGQGVVYETLHLADLDNYSTGGCVHIVVNNQIGFTTDPSCSRSTPHPTDVARSLQIPIFHVNGDDPEAVVRVCEIAAEWRQTFHRDVVINLVGYRRHGHNEIDPPEMTQPVMYQQIAKHPPTLQLYEEKLVSEGTCTKEETQAVFDHITTRLNADFDARVDYKPRMSDWLDSRWRGLSEYGTRSTAVTEELFHKVGSGLTNVPEGFVVHKRLQRMLAAKKQSIETGEKIDWATGEALAFGSLLMEGNHVRLSGQDVQRGTFAHRHAVLHDQKTNETITLLNSLDPSQAAFMVSNSSLSEFGVLGFELGYSMESPDSLVLWEAQFGDFANTAQVITDNFVAAGEQKWGRQTGLVMLLPHGYEGQGPEHSSCRLERFLQQTDGDPAHIDLSLSEEELIKQCNWQIVNCTTPANYFHVLRRQIHRPFRKPLVVATPKSLLRHPDCMSTMSDFTTGKFMPVIGDCSPDLVDGDKVKRVVFCTGKLYYDLANARKENKLNDVAIVRVEQVAPFPAPQVAVELERYPNAMVVCAQEEPKNNGTWEFVEGYYRSLGRNPVYAGRRPAAAPACGSLSQHNREQEKLINDALG